MRVSRLLIAMAAAFSASAYAVAPPGSGPQPSEGSQPSTSTEERDNASQPSTNSDRERNAWLSSNPSDAWQASAQRESESTQEPDRTAMRREKQPLPSDSSVPQQVPERTPAIGEQS